MLKVGITGGIGTGKSTIAKIFTTLNIPVFDADITAKKLMQEDESLKKSLIDAFGVAVYENGLLNRKLLASIVFNNPSQLSLLNNLVHPATIAAANKWFDNQHAVYAIKEAALLFESASAYGLNYIIGVQAPLAVRVNRVMQRDKVSREEVLARMERQIDNNLKMKLCDFVIDNSGYKMVIPQVLTLHNKLIQLSS